MPENILQIIASLENEQEKMFLIRESVKDPEEVLAAAIDVLQHFNKPEAVLKVALQIIQAIGYPTNITAIPMLIMHASNFESLIKNEACQLLIETGPVVIPCLLKLAQESDMVWDRIDEIGCTMNKELAHHIISELSRYPDEVLDAMCYLLQQPMKPWWDVAMQIIRAIGYPRNASAIPIVILHASDWNSLAQQIAFHVLQDMGPVVVAQYLMNILSGKLQGVGQWSYGIGALCLLLIALGTSYSTLCAPAIIYMMRQNEFAQKVEIATGLTVLEKIGPDNVTYALPTLIDLVSREGTSEVGKQARRFIQSFSEEALAPYKLLLESIAEKPEQQG